VIDHFCFRYIITQWVHQDLVQGELPGVGELLEVEEVFHQGEVQGVGAEEHLEGVVLLGEGEVQGVVVEEEGVEWGLERK